MRIFYIASVTLVGLVLTSHTAHAETALEHLQAEPRPVFKEDHTLLPLSRWGWSLPVETSLYDMKTGNPLIVERATGRRVREVKELPEDERQRWYIGPLFEQRPATAVSTVQTWNRLRALGREDLLAQRLKRTGKLDIESGYGAFRTPEIATEKDRLALIKEVESILHKQNPAGWWPGQWYGVDAIPSCVFTRNAINLITYLEMSAEENENSR